MGLFAQQQHDPAFEAAQHVSWARERGTRRLVTGFVIFLAAWFVIGKVWDSYLLRKQWPQLDPSPNGLTVVGTLDSRNYDRNMFRILQANQATRVELTDRGWHDIFDNRGGKMFTDATGAAIRSALDVDDVAGYAMFTPFLKYAIDTQLRRQVPGTEPNDGTVITYTEQKKEQVEQVSQPLGQMIEHFGARSSNGSDASDSEAEGGGSESGREEDKGLTIPASTLIEACPVVLTGNQFTHAEVEVAPASILQGETYTVHLYLTPEGRSRFYQWSHDHSDEDLIFVLKDQVVCAGRVKETMDVSDWTVGPIRDKAAARSLADYVNHKS